MTWFSMVLGVYAFTACGGPGDGTVIVVRDNDSSLDGGSGGDSADDVSDDDDEDDDSEPRTEDPGSSDRGGTVDLVFINESEWMTFDWLSLWECSDNLAYSYGFEITGWLDPGESWMITDVPTDICFRPELWNFETDYGVSWDGGYFPDGEYVLTIRD